MTAEFSEGTYKALRGLWKGIQSCLFPVTVTGLENIPAEGAAMICANHLSACDPLMLASQIKRPVSFMAKQELFAFKPLGALLKKIAAFPVARGDADIASVRTALGVLKSGDLLGIFPQGHRRKKSMTEEPPVKTGVAMIALRANVPVIPVRIEGSWKPFRRMYVTIGKPVEFAAGRVDKQAIDAATETLRESIFSLTHNK